MAAVIVGTLALSSCAEPLDIRYRLTVTIELFGEQKTGSSVIQTLFYAAGSGPTSPHAYTTITNGVAPVIDLGHRGWLVAAMPHSGPVEGPCRNKHTGTEKLLDAFGLNASDLAKLRQGKRDLGGKLMPVFVWFPRDEPYTNARQTCSEHLAQTLGADIQVISATIELVPNAPFKTVLEHSAPWLEEMRIDQRHGYSSQHKKFKPSKYAIERP